MNSVFRPGLFLAVALALFACAQPQPPAGLPKSVNAAVAPVNPLPSVDAAAIANSPASRLSPEMIRGTGSFVDRSRRHSSDARVTEDGDITLDFANADIRDVIRSVLGDLLKLNYVVDGKVQGTVTIESSKPLRRDAVLPVFERALSMNGLALLRSGDMYQVLTAADAPRQNGVGEEVERKAGRPGYGVEIVPLHYVSTAEMRRLLDPIAPPGAILQADSGRNLLVLAGTEQERASVLDDIALFDVDWLQGMSFSLYPVKSVAASQLVKELDQIVGGQNGPLKGMVQLIPLDRLNGVLAISSQSRYLEELQGWMERLDRPGDSVDRRIHVYHVQNGRAADLADVLSKTMGIGGKGSAAAPTAGPSGTMRNRDLAPPAGGMPSDGGAGPNSEAGGFNITADETNNGLVILATSQEYSVVEAALRQLDTVPLQVFLEAAVAEVTLTSDLKYGLQFFFQSGHHSVTLNNQSSAPIASALPGFGYTYSIGSNIQVILNALDGITDVKVVSSPQILVLNNHTASLQVGDQVPIATEQAVSTVTSTPSIVNSIQYHDTGVILKVTPRVNQGGMVMMDVSQEVSDVSATTTSSLDSPTIEQRKLSTTVVVRDGETVALGGLIQDSRTNTRNGIPLLSDIPYLGALFGTTENQGSRTELLVLITPHVVASVQRAKEVTDELRQKLDGASALYMRIQ